MLTFVYNFIMDSTAIGVLTATIGFSVVFKIYLKLTAGVCRSQRTMEGKTVIVTGANCGIGLETARELARRKARVILACRSMERGMCAAEDIISTTKNTDVLVRHLDLSSFKSIRKFASDIMSTETRLDVLIHNAGVTPPPGVHITEDNLELQFQTNHFGPFLLNHLLLDLLKQSSPSRIIVVSSVMHLFGILDFDNLNCEKHEREPQGVYCSTKLANILFTRELSKRLQGTGVTINALHPGAVETSIARNARYFVKYIIVPISYPFLKTSQSGAQTSVYLAVSEDVENISGEYFVDCKQYWTSPAAKDDQLASKLWDVSEILTGIKPDLKFRDQKSKN